MAKITTITNPLTGQPAQVDQLDHTAQQIDDGLNIARGVSNPNLLDNWYFGNPVNQRGQTSYSVNGYTIDRWYTSHSISFGTLIVDQTAGCVTISHDDDGGIMDFYQTLENPVTEIVTLSVLMLNGNLYSATGTLGNISLHTDEMYILSTSPSNVILRCNPGKTISMKAVKLELGTQQTLAHQENGNWVLNEIPDYGEQLARCQRYLYRINSSDKQYHLGGYTIVSPFMVSGSGNRAAFRVPSPMMRKKPSISASGMLFIKSSAGTSSKDISSLTLNVQSNDESGTNITFETTDFPANTFGTVVMDSCDIVLNAEL